MGALRGMWTRLAAMVGRRAAAASLDEEIRFHLEMETEKNVRAGMSPAEARRVALVSFGGVQRVREEHRDGRRLIWLEDAWADVRFGARSLRRTPGVTIAIVATLALGLGANAAIFSVLDRIYFRMPSGVVDPAGVMRLYVVPDHADAAMPAVRHFNYPAVAGMQSAIDGAAQVAAYTAPLPTSAAHDEPKVYSSFVDAGYFALLGVRPALGRFFAADEERVATPADVVVLSYDYWQRRFGGDSAVIGRRMRVESNAATIVGVAAKGFSGVDLDVTDIWLPLSAFHGFDGPLATTPWYRQRNTYFLTVLTRARQGASASAVAARATVGLRRDARQARWFDSLSTVAPGSVLESRGPAKPLQEFALSLRIAAVALIVLLIACANVANLLLSRAAQRRREIAVRLAMGISRRRLTRMLVTESVLLAAMAGIAAYVAAIWCGALLRGLLLPYAHWQAEVHGMRIVTFTAAAALLAALATAAAPALHATRTDLTLALKSGAREGGGRRHRLQAALVVAQSALAATLVIGAGLFVRSLHNVTSQRLGYDVDRLVFVRPALPEPTRPSLPPFPGASARAKALDSTRAARTLADLALVSDAAARLSAVPQVERTAVASQPPFYGMSMAEMFRADGDTLWHKGEPAPSVTAVSSSYFATVGMRVLDGRVFQANAGRGGPNELVINRAMARTFYPGTNAIGQCIRMNEPTDPCYTIVGVVEDGRRMDIMEEPRPQAYLPVGAAFGGYWVIVRAGNGHVSDVARNAREMAGKQRDGDEGQVMVLSDFLAPQFHAWRLGAWLFTSLASLALFVSAVGVYSTLTYAMTRRMHEMGVRIALGARAADVRRLVIRSGLTYALAGVSFGVVLAVALGRLVAALLYGVSPHDPETIVAAAAVLLVSACLAAMVPAWRAARVDPVVALRAET